jgi:hypothetical protein
MREPEEAAVMNQEDATAIPAANIGDTDLAALARTNPPAAREIARLVGLMNRGEETGEEFRRLCELLVEVGSAAAGEHLLRRNLDFYEGRALYDRLFGTAKPDEFAAAVAAFASQFAVELVPVAAPDFLVATFRTGGGPQRPDAFALLSRPCEVKIGYVERDRIEADVIPSDPGPGTRDAHEYLLLHFVNGVWELADQWPPGHRGLRDGEGP